MYVEFLDSESEKMYGGSLAPTRKGDAGLDLRIHSISDDGLIGCGIKMAIPDGFVGMVVPRSGLGFKYGVGLRNTVGVIDSNYRGEIMARLQSMDHGIDVQDNEQGDNILSIYDLKELEIFQDLGVGDRFAQMVVVPCITHCVTVGVVGETSRGEQGLGSSGVQ